MATSINRTQLLAESHNQGYRGRKASLQRAGVELPQHNVNGKKTAAKTTAKKSTAKKTTAAKKTSAKKTTTKKTAAKSAAKKS